MSRRRKSASPTQVELNLAAMLDMAFQLLAFFILTYRPGDLEPGWKLAMPPASAIPGRDGRGGPEPAVSSVIKDMNSLVVSVLANRSGEIGSMAVGDVPIATLAGLDGRMREILGEQNQPFDQVIVQIDPELRYEALVRVVDVCAAQRLPRRGKLQRLTFVELPLAVR